MKFYKLDLSYIESGYPEFAPRGRAKLYRFHAMRTL